jgi:hypothetical protein
MPHALEDLHYGNVLGLNLALPVAVSILVSAYALQIAGTALAARGRLAGALLLGAIGAIWCVGAIAVHGHDLLYAGPEYRHGLASKLLVALVIVLGGACAYVGVASTRIRTRR